MQLWGDLSSNTGDGTQSADEQLLNVLSVRRPWKAGIRLGSQISADCGRPRKKVRAWLKRYGRPARGPGAIRGLTFSGGDDMGLRHMALAASSRTGRDLPAQRASKVVLRCPLWSGYFAKVESCISPNFW